LDKVAPRSERNRIRQHFKQAADCVDRINVHLKLASELAQGKMPLLVELMPMFVGFTVSLKLALSELREKI
jgi:hypothetical protein